MKNFICYPLTPRVSSRFIGKVAVPSTGLVPGNIIIADTVANAITGNYEVFNAKTATSNDLGSKFFALVLNDGFETLIDNRRPNGNPNYFTYTYRQDDVAPIMFLEKHLKFSIGADCVSDSTKTLAVVGNYLVPVAGSNVLNAVETIPNGTFVALKILALGNTPIGGNCGSEFALSYVCTPILTETQPIATKYNLTVNQGVGTTLTIKKDGEIIQAGTGVLSAGDKLAIIAEPDTTEVQINGEEYAHQTEYVVVGNTVVVSKVPSSN